MENEKWENKNKRREEIAGLRRSWKCKEEIIIWNYISLFAVLSILEQLKRTSFSWVLTENLRILEGYLPASVKGCLHFGQPSWNKDIDYWWHEQMNNASEECAPEWMDAEDPLFILYTRYVWYQQEVFIVLEVCVVSSRGIHCIRGMCGINKRYSLYKRYVWYHQEVFIVLEVCVVSSRGIHCIRGMCGINKRYSLY